jgi:PAS domain S-box-containing protein
MVDLPSDGTKRVTQAAGLILVGLSVAVLIAWYIHFTSLIQIVPTLAPMQRMTALCFLLSGCALILTSAGRKQATMVLALVVLILAVAVSLEYALSADFGIDQLLGRDYINVRTSHPGRMSPVTAFCIVCSSLALLATASRLPARFASAYVGIVASILMVVGAVNIFGHVLGYTETFVWGHLSRMALHTSTAFALLGAGLMAWAWKKGHVEKGTPEWLPLSIGLGLAAGALGVWQALIANEHQEGDLSLLSHIILAGGLLGALLVAVAVAQTQQARRRSRELQTSSAMMQQLFDVAPDGLVMTDRHGTIIRVNEEAEQIFGYAPGELLAQPIERLIPEKLSELQLTHREDYHAVPSPRRTGNGFEVRARRKDLSEFPVEIALSELQSTEQGILVVAVVRDITKRKLAEEALRQSEARFRSVFEQGPIGVTLMGMDRRMFMVNATMCRMLGYSEEELTRMTPLDVTYPDDKDPSVGLMEHLFDRNFPVGKIEKRYVRKNGETMWASLTASVIRDQEGKPLYSVGLIEDITERKQAEAELRLGNEIFANMEEGVCLVRIDDHVIVHANPKFEKMFGHSSAELMGKNVAVINADFPRDPEEVVEEIIAAIRRSGVWRGEILHKRKNGTVFWCAVTVSPFQHPKFGGVGISVHQDITELKRAQETLRASEERFRGIFEQGPIGVALLEADHRMTKVNTAFRRMLGYTEAELARMTPLDMTYPDDRESCMGLLGRLDKGEIPVCTMEKRYVKKSGELMWVSLTASVIRDQEGRPLHGLGMIEDITERKRAEEELRTLTQRLSLATRSAAMGVWEWNPGSEQAIWDDTMFQIMGVPKKASVGREDWARQMHPDDVAQADAFVESIIREKTQARLEFRVVRPEGSLRYVSAAGGAVLDAHGNVIGVVGIAFDITQRREAEQKLAEQAALLDLAGDAIIVLDLEGRILFWNRGAADTYGWSADEAVAQIIHTLLQTRFPIPPREIQDAILDHGRWEGELEHTTRDGNAIVVTSRWSLRRDGNGAPSGYLEINRDITVRKHTEEQLHSLMERLSLATRSASIGIWDWDLRTHTTVWDDAMFEMFGIPKVVPMAYEEFVRHVHPEDLPKEQASLQRAIQGKAQDAVEFRIIRPDGSIRHIYSAEGVVLDETGNVVRVVGTAVDITERKQMEAQIEASKEQLVTSARLSALGMMAGGIAHEINNPLGIIHALASDLIDAVKDEGTAPPSMVMRNSTRIRETSDRIARIIKSLRHISREGSSDKFRSAPIGRILEETLELCRARFKANDIKLLLPAHIPELSVRCREVQIAQVLLNLLQNAFDAVVEEKGERWVRLDVASRDDSLVISVTDSGPGIPPELRTRIMEPFFTTKPVGKGTGLGLSLSKNIAVEHGGELEYAEENGRTCFSLALPVVREAKAVWN